jgi:hypothetical protein
MTKACIADLDVGQGREAPAPLREWYDRSKSSGHALDQLHHQAAAVLPALLMIFMAGNLAAIGLDLDLREALAPLRDRRFLLVVLVWNCLLSPVSRGFSPGPSRWLGPMPSGLN